MLSSLRRERHLRKSFFLGTKFLSNARNKSHTPDNLTWTETRAHGEHVIRLDDWRAVGHFNSLPKVQASSSLKMHQVPSQGSSDPLQVDSIPEDGESTVDVAGQLYKRARQARIAMNHRKSEKNAIESCVFGGEAAVHYAWCSERVKPYCIFVAEDIPTPKWIERKSTNIPIIRCSQSLINTMLSARRNENFAGHFPAPSVKDEKEMCQFIEEIKTKNRPSPDRVLVLHHIRDPMNLGQLIKSAVSFGFRHVICIGCSSLYNEKVMRASDGMIYDSALHAFELPVGASSMRPLEDLSNSGNLVTCFAIPDQNVQSVSTFAENITKANSDVSGKSSQGTGIMLFLGSEHYGLQTVIDAWKGNADQVSISMDNPLLDSLNVSHAGSILMHALRPKLVEHYHLTSR